MLVRDLREARDCGEMIKEAEEATETERRETSDGVKAAI